MIPLDLQTDAFASAWSDFKQHRKQIGHPMTERAERMILKRCQGWGDWYARILVLMSVEKGWRDVFEPDRPTRYELESFVYAWSAPFSASDGGGFYYYRRPR